MVRFEEVRPLEGMWDPLQVRIELRQMFEHWLVRLHPPRHIFEQDVIIDELSILELCQHYRLEYPGGATDVAKVWDESEQRIAESGPTFEDLVRLGWVFFDGSRWIMQSSPPGTSLHITYPSPSTKTFLTGLGRPRLVAKTDEPSSQAKALAARIIGDNWLERNIPTQNPDLLAGRLWKRLCPKPQPHTTGNSSDAIQAAAPVESEVNGSSVLLDADAEAVDRAFSEWSAWCDILGCAGKWDIGWSGTEMRYCREAAQRALVRQTLWGNWNIDAARYTDVLEKTFLIPQEQLRYCTTSRMVPPRTLVSRVDWLKWPDVEHLMMWRFGTSTVSFAFNLLCSELENSDIGSSIWDVAATVLTFAAEHPMALQQFLFRVNAAPALLVDMLLYQHTACIATKVAIEWRSESGRNSDRNVTREAQTKAYAVQDALSLLAYHLHEGNLDLEELASLITWCYASSDGSTRAVADSRKPIGRQLLELVARDKEAIQPVVLRHLVSDMAYESNVPRACFAGVLDGLSCLSSMSVTDTLPIVAQYLKFARDLHLSWTDVPSLSSEQAAQLLATAFAQDASDRDALLVPFDSAKLLREAPGDGEPSQYSVAQTLREHVRLLARAVAGWSDEVVPTELCDAFLLLISRSAIEHAEKGRVGALTDRYNPNRFLARENGSPAQDLAAAWRRLDGSHQEAMLQVLVQSDDPVLLAELSQHLPAAAKSSIQVRLRQLRPGEASTVWTWPELQHRIESFLVAGEYGLAREHLDEAEQDLDRAPQEFRLNFFSLNLRLLLKEENWIVLDGTVVPSALNEFTARQAQDQLDFYRATSQLLRPNGNLAGARNVLERLAASPNAASVYKENIFAVAIQQLLGPTLHPLVGADKVAGERLLAEINAAVAVNERQASSSLLANRALLLLALKRPEDALESVAVRRREARNPDLELITVLATVEMGRREVAMAILDAAITEFDTDDRLIALKNDLEASTLTPSVTSPSVNVDTISSIRSALQQLSELLPNQVGNVLGPPGGGVRGYLIRQVSRSVAALQHMVAMLRNRKNPENDAKLEDDLNTAVREVLGARLAVAKWDVADQSLGGSTQNDNPGERDAVIRVSGQEISIYEALVCSSVEKANLKKHFDKLLSYGVCEIYFHVTYSYAKELKPLLDYVRKMLEHEHPPSLTYLGCEHLGPPDYETSGYIATYQADHREVAVVFLIADLKA